ncbi:MAG TPA: hypothetical protein VLO29_00925 [Salegentibacter sp.]|nr:hypothetical protein [Salegentibacter sp.]
MTTLINILINMLLATLGFQQEVVKDPLPDRTEISAECTAPEADSNVYKC